MREADTIELRWFLAVIRRRAGPIIGCTLLALVVAFGVTSQMLPVYEATTTLLVVAAEDVRANDYNTLMAGERLALTYGQMLKGRSTLQAAISRLAGDGELRAAYGRSGLAMAPRHTGERFGEAICAAVAND